MENQLMSDVIKDHENSEFAKKYCEFQEQLSTVKEVENYYQSIAQIFKPGKLKGTKLLDFGCGPTVHKMAIPSGQFKDITLSEFSEVNREEVKKWLTGDPDSFDWSRLFKMIAKVEGHRDLAKGVDELNSRIRSSVQSVIPCNILAENILPENIGEFDVITSFYCLEACCFDEETYKTGIKKLGRYVKKGGALIMEASINCSYYNSYKKFEVFPLSETLIKEALGDGGFMIKEWYYQPAVDCIVSNKTGTVTFCAVKE